MRESRRAVAEEAVVQRAVAPGPPTAEPVEATDTEAVVRVVVDGPQEEKVLTFPFIGDELGVSEEVIQNIGVQDRFTLKFLAEQVSDDHLATFLVR